MHPPALVLAVLSAGSGCYFYEPQSYLDLGTPFPGAHVDLGGCIDLAIGYADDAQTGPGGRVIEYSFGNHCYHRVDLDLGAVRAIEYGADRVARPLVAYDPRHELRAMSLDALWLGHERIEYDAPGVAPAPGSAICVDVGALDRSAPRQERWVCTGAVVGAPGAIPGAAVSMVPAHPHVST